MPLLTTTMSIKVSFTDTTELSEKQIHEFKDVIRQYSRRDIWHVKDWIVNNTQFPINAIGSLGDSNIDFAETGLDTTECTIEYLLVTNDDQTELELEL